MINNQKLANSFVIRFLLCIVIWILYLLFMQTFSPLGVEWLDWHAKRIENFAEFLNKNGYFKTFGFSVWTKCQNCNLSLAEWKNKIYASTHALSYIFYLIFYEIFNRESFIIFASYFDKIIIFFSGLMISEILIKLYFKNKDKNFFISLIPFLFFTINPWTYKMILAPWVQVYFIFFILLSSFMFIQKKYKNSLFFFFIAGVFDYQSLAGLGAYYACIYCVYYFTKNKKFISDFFLVYNKKYIIVLILVSFLPVALFLSLKFLAILEFDSMSGSNLISRIGVTGYDIHNGGILGSLQFLGGNRITQCITIELSDFKLNDKIYIYNCALSILSMFFLSLISIFGLFFLFKQSKREFKKFILPNIFLILSYIFILQQSMSVHLMGYSYIFSFLFSAGIFGLLLHLFKKFNHSHAYLILCLPVILGFLLLMIRVNMLTGING